MATLEKQHLSELHRIAAELGVERYRMLPRSELIAAIAAIDPDAGTDEEGPGPAEEREDERPRRRSRRGRRGRGAREDREDEDGGAAEVEAEEATGEPVSGVLDVTPRGHGFIRLSGLDATEEDVYVSPSQIRRCELQRGDEVAGPARRPRRGERYPALIHVDTINGVAPGESRPRLADATPVHPTRRIDLSPAPGGSAEDAILLRSVDLLLPLARGQRVLVDARPGSGRTTLLRALAGAISHSEDIELIVLLIDERPEEVASWREAAPGADLAVATAEMRSGEQLRLVELALGRASRKAESGADVVLLVDSISRIAVAADDPGRVKPIFGAGRETAEEGVGSLTVVATTLGDGGEDQGSVERSLETTENVLIVLDPALASRGIYPAIDFTASRIAGEEHIREAEELAAARKLRTELGSLTPELAAAEVRRLVEGSADSRAALGTIRT
ncbi:MAG: Rho termination factor N-terminal domain-containing protein [Solirubrobacterales bacterium]|nr:Rho termination factor N-terminal domain-containing protein [Solirubrobacterales bacterium]